MNSNENEKNKSASDILADALKVALTTVFNNAFSDSTYDDGDSEAEFAQDAELEEEIENEDAEDDDEIHTVYSDSNDGYYNDDGDVDLDDLESDYYEAYDVDYE